MPFDGPLPPDTVTTVLLRAKALLDDAGWCKGNYSKDVVVVTQGFDRRADRRYCIVGAIAAAVGNPTPNVPTPLEQRVHFVLYRCISLRHRIMAWMTAQHYGVVRETVITFNDYRETSYSDIGKLLDKAIALSRRTEKAYA